MANAEIKLNEFCETTCQNLERCTLQEKRLALDVLDIKVTATPEQIDIKGVVPIDITPTQASASLLTTERTSGCLIVVDVASNGEQSVSILPR